MNPHQHVPLDQYRCNLKTIIQTILDHDQKDINVLLISPPPIEETKLTEFCRVRGKALDRRLNVTAEYRNACQSLYMEYQTTMEKDRIGYLDSWMLFALPSEYTAESNHDKISLEDGLVDGIHFGIAGNKALGDALLTYIPTKWPQISSMNYAIPTWHDMSTEMLQRLFSS